MHIKIRVKVKVLCVISRTFFPVRLLRLVIENTHQKSARDFTILLFYTTSCIIQLSSCHELCTSLNKMHD